MARVNNLTNFLTDVATAIKTKKGSSTAIPAANFDTEILALPSQGVYQTKEMNITTNGNYEITPDENYDAMDKLRLSIDVPTGGGGIQEFSSKQAMEEAGLEDEDKAIVYNSTDKLVGYYEMQEQSQLLFPKVTDCTINDSANTIVYDYTNATGILNTSTLLTDLVALMNEMGAVSSGGWMNMGQMTVLPINGDLYGFLIYRTASGSQYHNNGPTVVYKNNKMYFGYNTNNTNISLHKYKLDLDNMTYQDVGTISVLSSVSYATDNTQYIFDLELTYLPWVIYTTSRQGQATNRINTIGIVKAVSSGASTTTSYTITAGTNIQNRTVPVLLDIGLKEGSKDANATANDILAGKSGYVNGVKILGTRGGGTIRQYDSLEDLEEDTEIQDGELALVYKQEFIPFVDYSSESYQNGKVKMLQNVVFDTAISSSSSLRFNTRIDNNYVNYYLQLTASGATLKYRPPSSRRDVTLVTWTTSDGLTYVADQSDMVIDNIYELYASGSSYTNIKHFIEVWNCTFTGIYEHTSSGNVIAKTQLTIDNANDLYNGEIGYGKNGVVIGDGSIMQRFSTSELDDLYMSSSYKKSNKTSLMGNVPAATNNVELQYYGFTNTALPDLDNSYHMVIDYIMAEFPDKVLSESKIDPVWYRWIGDKLYLGSYEYIYDDTTTTYTNITLHVSIYDSVLNQFNDYIINLPSMEGRSMSLIIYYIDPTSNQVWLIQHPYASDYTTIVDYTLNIYNYLTGELVRSTVLARGYDLDTYGIAKDPVGNYMYLQYSIYDGVSSWGYNRIVRYDITANTFTTLYSYSSTASSRDGVTDQWRRYDIIEHPDCTILFNYGKISYINHGETTEHIVTTLTKTAINNNGSSEQSVNIAYTDGNYIYVSLYTLDDPTAGVFGYSTRRLYRFNKTTGGNWEMLYEPTEHDNTFLYSDVIDDNGTKYYACGNWYYLDPERWITSSVNASSRTDFDYYSGVSTDYSHFHKVGNYLGLLRLDTSNRVIKQRVFSNIINYSTNANALTYTQQGLILPVYEYSGTAIPLGNITIEAFQNNKYLDTIMEEVNNGKN